MISKPHTNIHSQTVLTHTNLKTSRGVIYSCCTIGLPYLYNTTTTGDNNNITRDKALFITSRKSYWDIWICKSSIAAIFEIDFVVLPVFAAALLWYVVHIYFLIKSFTFLHLLFTYLWNGVTYPIPNCSRAFDIAICGGMLLIGFLVATSTYATRILTHFFGRLHTSLCMHANVYGL